MAIFHLCCSECGASFAEDPSLLVCPTCSENQKPGGITRGVLEVVIEDLPRAWPESPFTSAEFLKAFLPLGAEAVLPPLPVGGTPLVKADRLGPELGLETLWLKDDTRNPSGSTKDRASLLVVAKAMDYGFSTIAAASTGNAATALAAVAAAAGQRAVAFVPASAPVAKLTQMLAYGATLFPVEGTYDQAFELCLAACDRLGWYNRNTALNPFTVEGKKTVALEIVRQMRPEAPDVVLVPTGDGVILAGVAKGFRDLERAGLLDRVPRLIAVQPVGSAAIAEALRSGAEEVSPVVGAASVADSLVVEWPRNALGCLRAVRESKGHGVIVSDEEILTAIHHMATNTGIFPEPAAAAGLAGLSRALEEGLIHRAERVVVLVTGTGLKDIGAAGKVVRLPPSLPPHLEAVLRREAD